MPTVPLPSHRGTGSWPRLWSCSFSLVSLEFSRSQTLGPWTLSGPWGQCSQSLSIPFSLPLPNTETAMTRKGPFAFNFMPAPWIQSSLELGRREVGSEEPTEGAYRLTSWRNGSPSFYKTTLSLMGRSFLPPPQSLTCVDTVSQSRAGDEVPGALRPQLSEDSARLPDSQSLGSTAGSRGLRTGVPKLPASEAAISSPSEAQAGIRGGLL